MCGRMSFSCFSTVSTRRWRARCAGGRFDRSDGDHAFKLCGISSDLSVCGHAFCQQYGADCGFQLSGRVDDMLYPGSDLFLSAVGPEAVGQLESEEVSYA